MDIGTAGKEGGIIKVNIITMNAINFKPKKMETALVWIYEICNRYYSHSYYYHFRYSLFI